MFTTITLLDKLPNALTNVHNLKDIIYFPDLHLDPNSPHEKAPPELEKAFTSKGRRIYAFDSFLEMGNGAEVTWKVSPTDLAMIMYTSGELIHPLLPVCMLPTV